MSRTLFAFFLIFAVLFWVIESPAAHAFQEACEPQSQALLMAVAECDGFQSPLDCVALNAFMNRPLPQPTLGKLASTSGYDANSVFALRLKITADFEMLIRQGLVQLSREATPTRWLIIRDGMEAFMDHAPTGLKPTLQAYARRFDDYAEVLVTRSVEQLPKSLAVNPMPAPRRATINEYNKLTHEIQKRKKLPALKQLEQLASIRSPMQLSFYAAFIAAKKMKNSRPDLSLALIQKDLEEVVAQERGLKSRRTYAWVNNWTNSRPSPLTPVVTATGENTRRTLATVAMATAGSYASLEATQSCLGELLKKEKIKLTPVETDRLSRRLSLGGPAHRCDLFLDRRQLMALLQQPPSRSMCGALEALSRDKLANLNKFQPELKQVRCESMALNAKLKIEGEDFNIEIKPSQDYLTVTAPFNTRPGEQTKFTCRIRKEGDQLAWCEKIESASLDEKHALFQMTNSILLTPRYAWQTKMNCPKEVLEGPGSRPYVRRQVCQAGKVLQAINTLLTPALGPCFGERMNLNST